MSLGSSTVALVGRRLPHNENLGLAYLRAALTGAGLASQTHYVNDGDDLRRAAAAIVAAQPGVVGLSLADGGSSFMPLALGELLARRGYRGHVTAGGQFATLARDWLLERYPWLDSVVRFAGEVPLVGIAERVARGEAVQGVPGVTTRDGDGAPAPVLDDAPMRIRPERDELPAVLGWPAAHIAASRGCRGRCQYCGPAALHALERREGARAELSARTLTGAGVGGVRRREIDAVCDEMAHLWHDRGVRYFYFVDEHLLPYDEPGALAYIAEWRDGLRARRVGALGIGGMLRADRITPAIVRAFADLGLCRCFVGLELATAEEGRRFARPAPTDRELALLGTFAEAGVATVSNLMLVEPYSTPATIAAGIDLLSRVPGGVFEATRMMVYHGTRLAERMAQEGRLIGNPLRHGYVFEDPTVERFAEIFTRLRGEAFWDYSVAYRTHDAYLALSLARRLRSERAPAGLEAQLERARLRQRALYIAAYRSALDLALSGRGFADATPLVRRVRDDALEIARELDQIEARLLAAAPEGARMFAPMRSAAARVVSFAVLLPLAACGSSVTGDPGATGGTAGGGGAAADAGAGGSPADAGSDADSGPHECTEADVQPATVEVQATLAADAPCFSGTVTFQQGAVPTASFYLNAYGSMVSLVTCNTAGAEAAVAAQEAAAAAALAGKVPACITFGSDPTYVYAQGGATTQAQTMADAISVACGPLFGSMGQFRIVLDASGHVVAVVPEDPGAAELADCVMTALAGMTFPCLASFEVCPEYVIAE